MKKLIILSNGSVVMCKTSKDYRSLVNDLIGTGIVILSCSVL